MDVKVNILPSYAGGSKHQQTSNDLDIVSYTLINL